eukprot:Clim_evm68s214 gene=Clim_evmTU68s214
MVPLFWFSLGFQSVAGSIISKSELVRCVDDGIIDQQCENKLVVIIDVISDSGRGEVYSAVVNEIDDNSEGTGSGRKAHLQDPFQFLITKSVVYASSNLIYRQSFNSKPFEKTFRRTNFLGIFDDCEADFVDGATCGYALDENGERIFDSQGFCCSCSIARQLGLETGYSRSGIDCQIFGLNASKSSAHCLRFDDLWYAGYDVQPPRTEFTIGILRRDIELSVESAEPTTTLLGSLSSSVPQVKIENVLRAELVGSFALSSPMADHSSRMLLIPHPGDPNHRQRQDMPNSWLLVDKSMISLDGNECDKIGVGYSAFKYHNDACIRPDSTCLANQPTDLWESDQQRRADDIATQFSADTYGKVVGVFAQEEQYQLAYSVNERHTSVVRIELNADDLQYTVNRSDGTIIAVRLNTFEALSRNGSLECLIKNVGTLTATFTLIVRDCSPGIASIPAQSFDVEPNRSEWRYFDVFTQTPIGQADNECTVELQDSLASPVHVVIVQFETNSTQIVKGEGQDFEEEPDDTGRDEPDGGGVAIVNWLGDIWSSLTGIFGLPLLSIGLAVGVISLVFFMRRVFLRRRAQDDVRVRIQGEPIRAS